MVAIGENEIRITADRDASMHSGWRPPSHFDDSLRYTTQINRLHHGFDCVALRFHCSKFVRHSLLSFLFSFKNFFVSNPSLISQGIRTGVIYMEKADGGRWIHAKFVRFCSNFMNVSRSPVPDDAVSGEN